MPRADKLYRIPAVTGSDLLSPGSQALVPCCRGEPRGCVRGHSPPFYTAPGPQGPLDLDRPTYILGVHRVASGGSGDPTVWRRSNASHQSLNLDFLYAMDGRGNKSVVASKL
ncbi:hypothetical protein PIB30_067138 [Stylosanthes scabra]|uniref:Uncharacterized protein n=1 Tax=Stylosanthes scabra TaxID=79078 RepID=A0ABU6WQI4_9FABA|nr:hypothetical protein [Stylosanthes scabra]